jgi:hypothetical protein
MSLGALAAIVLSTLTASGQNYADRFEPNNSLAQAKVLEADAGVVEEPVLTVYPIDDVDFFKFTLPATGQAAHYLEIDAVMSHPLLGVGRVDFALLDAGGNTLATKSTPVGAGSARISLEGRAAGNYGLKAEGRVGSYGWYNLTIHLPTGTPPTITTHPQSQTVTAGANVTFAVVASGTPPLSYQWRKDGQDLAGATAASLVLNNVQTSHAGTYTVRVSNSAGAVTSNPATLTVNPASTPPTITTHPQSQTVTAGANVTFTVAATGTPPLSYQWRKDGQDLPGQTSSTLTLANVQPTHAGTYTVRVSNSAGQVTSNPATLTVNPVGPPPGVAERDLAAGYQAGVPFTVTLYLEAGETITAYGVEDGPPAGWTVANISHGGEFDSQNRKVKWDPFFANDGRQQTLTYQVTPPAGAAGVATFAGVASFDGINVPIGGDQTISPGTAGTPPTVTTHPQSQTVTAGANVTFTVVASGTPPLSYQWRFNRAPIPGATGPTLVLNAVQASDAGSYTVVVSNAHGNATSQPAILTVNAAGGVRLSEVRWVPREGLRFKVTAPVGQRWVVEASTDLRQWLEIGTLEMTTGTREFTDAEAVVFPRSFYRLRQIAP